MLANSWSSFDAVLPPMPLLIFASSAALANLNRATGFLRFSQNETILKKSSWMWKFSNAQRKSIFFTKTQIQTAVCVDCKHEGHLTKVNVFSLQCICLISFCICIWRFGIWWKVDKAAKHHPRLSWLSAFQPPPSVYMSLCGVHWYPSCMYIGDIGVHGTVMWYAWCTDVLCVVPRSSSAICKMTFLAHPYWLIFIDHCVAMSWMHTFT